MSGPLTEAALSLAAEGLPVFPCGSDKQAIVKWRDAATTDEASIRRMFASTGAVMIGMPTGEASGIVAVDLDMHGEVNASQWYEDNEYRIPETRCHDTLTGGMHLLFRMPDADIRNSASKIGVGVD